MQWSGSLSISSRRAERAVSARYWVWTLDTGSVSRSTSIVDQGKMFQLKVRARLLEQRTALKGCRPLVLKCVHTLYTPVIWKTALRSEESIYIVNPYYNIH
jgi:hypothetical protein